MEPRSINDGMTRRQRHRFLEPGNRSIYLIATRSICPGSLSATVRVLVEAGIGAVQLREKDASAEDLVELSESLRDALRRHEVPLILNDRLDLVAAIRASGVHLGSKDASVSQARERLGPDAIVGATAHSLREALEAEHSGADYLGVGPIFESRTKRVSEPRGPEWLATIVNAVSVPCFAIGGVNLDTMASVEKAGVHGVAVCEALLCASDGRSVARAMRNILDLRDSR